MEEHLIRIVEDHALIEEFLTHLAWCLKNGKQIPSHIPALNDSMTMDALSTICEELVKDE